MIRLRHLAAASAVALLLTVAATPLSTPVLAQSIVFDPNNYAQNVLTAARELQQINNQITALQNQAQMLINQARNLASLPYSSLQQLQSSIQRTQQLLAQAQNITFNVQQIDHAFQTTYGGANASQSSQSADRQRASALAELRRGLAGCAARAGWRRRQSRHQPHPDVGAGDVEPVGDRRPCGNAGRQPASRPAGAATRRSHRNCGCPGPGADRFRPRSRPQRKTRAGNSSAVFLALAPAINQPP